MNKQSTTKIIAHRGFWKIEGSAQNSIFALKKAAQFGFDGTEFDVHFTKDEVLIVYHDDEINGKLIEDSLFEELVSFRLENNETIPTLKAYLTEAKKYPDLELIIEIKSQNNFKHEENAVKALLQLINDLSVDNQYEFISFSASICSLLKKNNLDLKVSYLNGDLTPKQIKNLRWNGFDYDYEILLSNPSWLTEAKDLKLSTNSWTVNDEEIMKQLLDFGIEMITTDEPELLVEVLKNYVK